MSIFIPQWKHHSCFTWIKIIEVQHSLTLQLLSSIGQACFRLDKSQQMGKSFLSLYFPSFCCCCHFLLHLGLAQEKERSEEKKLEASLRGTVVTRPWNPQYDWQPDGDADSRGGSRGLCRLSGLETSSLSHLQHLLHTALLSGAHLLQKQLRISSNIVSGSTLGPWGIYTCTQLSVDLQFSSKAAAHFSCL